MENELQEQENLIQDSTVEEQEQQESDHEEKRFTQQDLDKIIERRLKRERDRITKMFTDPNEELSKRERAIEEKEMRLDAKGILIKNDIPIEAIDLINYKDRETMQKSIELLNKVGAMFKEQVTRKILVGGETLTKANPPQADNNDRIAKAFRNNKMR